MIKEWLPQLIVGIIALTAGAFGTWLSSSSDKQWDERQSHLLGGLSHHEGNATVEARLPPRPLMAWAAFSFVALGGFYVAAAMAGWVHRS